jgi:single-strand DNA-binding protein
MGSLNKVHLGDKPKVKDISDKAKVATVSLATSKEYFDKEGVKHKKTQWHTLELWNGWAKVAEQYFDKGMTLFVEGSLEYTETEKEGKKQYFTKIVVTNFQFLSSKNKPLDLDEESKAVNEAVQSAGTTDDLPF